jgi:hypothetical protein
MPSDTLEALELRMRDNYGEDSLTAEDQARLGRTFALAQQFQEQALLNCEEMLTQAKRHLATLATRRSKIMQRRRVGGGGDWTDMDEVREQLGEIADELSDQLDEVAEAFVVWLESQRTELEEENQDELAGTRDWRAFQRWIEAKIDSAQDFADALIEQFDEEAAIVAQR